VDHVAEIFQTPLTGSYNWDYTIQDDRIKKLYDLGKQLNWDPEMDIDWDRPWPVEEPTPEMMNLHDYEPYLAMDEKNQGRILVAYECVELVPVSPWRAGCVAGGIPALLLCAYV
jgi:hypothetical protein